MDALNVMALPGHITGLEGVMLTDGVSNGFTVMVTSLLVAVAGSGQIAGSAVITTFTLSPLASVAVVNEEAVAPDIFEPFNCHWYETAAPALALGVAVNVTDCPAQMAVAEAELVTDGTTLGVTIIDPLMDALAQGPVAVMV
jgi:hypothetical protein